MIVNTGKDVIGRTLASSLRPDFVVGIGSSAPSANNTQLDFEVERVPTRVASYDAATKVITYTATLPSEIELNIAEVGLVASVGETSGKILSIFDQGIEQWEGGTPVSTNILVGSSGLQVAAGTAKTLDMRPLSYSLQNTDVLQVAYFGAGGSVEVRLNNTDADYLSFTFTPVAGHNIASTAISAMTRVGDVNLSSVSGLTVVHSGAGNVTMDALRITSPVGEDVLIVRQKLAAPRTKVAGMPLDIEIPLVIDL